jgi:hypothetical protein
LVVHHRVVRVRWLSVVPVLMASASCGSVHTAASGGQASPSIPALSTTIAAPTCLTCGHGPTLPPTTLNVPDRDRALQILSTDPVLSTLAGHWHVQHLQTSPPWVYVNVAFDTPAQLQWTDTEVGCIDGQAQQAQYAWHAAGVTQLDVNINLATGPSVSHLPGPAYPPPTITKSLVRVLGPPSGPCPPPPPD